MKKKLNKPILLDTTLRDGEQSPGLYFTHDEKIFLAQQLDQLGVEIIEAGIPGMGREEKNVFKELIGLKLKSEILAWNRLTIEDIHASLDAEVKNIHVSIPTSNWQLSKKMDKKQAWVLQQMDEVISFAVNEGLNVSLGAEDASRTDIDFVSSVFYHAQELGVSRVRYADTLGILTPEKTSFIINKLTKMLSIPLDFHAHNDFGLANANSLCAWKAGAQVVSCSLLGLGERAGNTALEEFVGILHFLEGQFAGYDFKALRQLCEKTSIICGRPIPSHKPLFGSEIFKHESGIHVDGLIKDLHTYELFPPEIVGGNRSLIIGKHSGRSAVKYLAKLQKKELTDAQANDFLLLLRGKMQNKKEIDAQKEFESFLSNLNT